MWLLAPISRVYIPKKKLACCKCRNDKSILEKKVELCLLYYARWGCCNTLFEIFIFCPKIQLWFPKKIVDFFWWKTRENVVVLGFLAVDNFDFTRKIVKKIFGEKLVKMLGFCQNWIFGQKFDFSNSVPGDQTILWARVHHRKNINHISWRLRCCCMQLLKWCFQGSKRK